MNLFYLKEIYILNQVLKVALKNTIEHYGILQVIQMAIFFLRKYVQSLKFQKVLQKLC